MAKARGSTVLTLRVPQEVDRRIEARARRCRKTKSEVLRDAFGGERPVDPAREARRQSLLVSRRDSERDAMEFLESAADDRGWT